MNLFQSTHKPTRREFVIQMSLASMAMFFTSMLTGGCESWLEQIRNRPMRRWIRDATDVNHDIDCYRIAVAAMKALGNTDLRNWTNQASIHNNNCPHGNWFFFPWHRAYLFSFEKICQKLSGDSKFGLPYWNWCCDGHLPAQFWEPPAGNTLYDSNRAITSSSVASTSSVGLPLVDGYCNEPNFTLFAGGSTTGLRTGGGSYGNIEGTPHNYIHGTFILGDMGTYMSPLDAIFWCHHCMVDLCWYEWNILRNHPNTSDTNWSNFNFTGMFSDADGNPSADISVLATLLMPLLSYQYETDISCNSLQPSPSVKTKSDFQHMQDIIKQGANMQLEIKQRYEVQRGLEINALRPGVDSLAVNVKDFESVFTSERKDRVLLTLKHLAAPPTSDVFLRIFLNKPDANTNTPIEDPHYAGSFYFFTHGDHANMQNPNEAPDYIVDVTSTLTALQKIGELANFDNVKINVVAVPVDPNKPSTVSFSVKGMELAISPVNVQLMKF